MERPDDRKLLEGYILHQILGDDYQKFPKFHDSVIALWGPRLQHAYTEGYKACQESMTEAMNQQVEEINFLYQQQAGESL